MRIVFIGHVCFDRNVVRGQEQTMCGGGVMHGSVTARRLGADVTVLTKCEPRDAHHFDFLCEAGVRIELIPSARSTSIRNIYPTDNPDDRRSELLARAEPFSAADLQEIEGDVVQVNPLWSGEFPPELLPALRGHAKTIVLDAQGFVRHAEPDGRLVHRDWADKERFLPLLDVFKADQGEAHTLTGLTTPVEAARRLAALGAATVLLTHKAGVVAATSGAVAEASFGPYPLEGRTGRGDTCTAAFVMARERLSLADAVREAADITTRKMQYAGPYRG